MITCSPLYGPCDGGVVAPHQEAQDWLRAEQARLTRAERTLPPPNTGWISMARLKRAHPEQWFESKLSNYGEARSAMLPSVSTELAANKRVDMESARNLEEHPLLCPMRTSESSIPKRFRGDVPASCNRTRLGLDWRFRPGRRSHQRVAGSQPDGECF